MGDLFTYLTVPVRVLGLLVWRGPRLIWSGILFFIKGPRHPSWSFGLHMSVETVSSVHLPRICGAMFLMFDDTTQQLRQYLISNVSEAEWALKADQLISTVPEPIRSGCRLRKAYHIPFHPLALGFIREKMAGQLTKEALAQHHSTAEWIEPCDVSMHRQGTILMLHGGGFVMGSPQFHRWLSCALSKGTGMRVLGILLSFV